MGKSAIVVKRYSNEREYQKDAKNMLSKGYEVQSVISEQPRSGCARIILIGIFAAIFKPKPVLVVTYRLSSQVFSISMKDFQNKQVSSNQQDFQNKQVNSNQQDFPNNQEISKW